MIEDRDPDDENDHPETDREWLRWLKLQIARVKVSSMLTPAEAERAWRLELARAWANPAPFVGVFETGPHHDPGDEDNSAELRYERGVVLSFLIRT